MQTFKAHFQSVVVKLNKQIIGDGEGKVKNVSLFLKTQIGHQIVAKYD